MLLLLLLSSWRQVGVAPARRPIGGPKIGSTEKKNEEKSKREKQRERERETKKQKKKKTEKRAWGTVTTGESNQVASRPPLTAALIKH